MKVRKWSVWIPRLGRHVTFVQAPGVGYAYEKLEEDTSYHDLNLFYLFAGIGKKP